MVNSENQSAVENECISEQEDNRAKQAAYRE